MNDEMMEIVIKIPKDTYKNIIESEYTEHGFIWDEDKEVAIHAIKNGTPLPEGHGRLKDADKIAKEVNVLKDNWNRLGNEYESGRYESYAYAVDWIDASPTIIEADKEGE